MRVRADSGRGARLVGAVDAPAVVSTIDGWTTSRSHAERWLGGRYELNCIMVADGSVWAVLGWGALGLGDMSIGRDGHQEVLVLGGRGRVRWEIDSPAADLKAALAR